VAVEVKSLEDDGSTRLSNLANNLRHREDWPEFYGKWPIKSVLANLDNPESAKRQTGERIGSAIAIFATATALLGADHGDVCGKQCQDEDDCGKAAVHGPAYWHMAGRDCTRSALVGNAKALIDLCQRASVARCIS
jgi:hypothetical protein